ncbi:hypothetical protein H0O03_02105 [Candidatus Micrarchaeota archaeon]|nr:hypothetical protein [Candidatus Micrarchaeota archaeon]
MQKLAKEHGTQTVSAQLWNLAAEHADEKSKLVSIVSAVGMSGVKEFAPVIMEHGLNHGSPGVRLASVKALSALREPVSLSFALHDSDNDVVLSAAEGLAQMGPLLKPAAIRALAEHGLPHGSLKVVAASAKAIAAAGDFKTLFESGIASEKEAARDAAARAFGAAGSEAVAKLAELGLRSDKVTERTATARALGKIIIHEPEGRVDAILKLVDHLYEENQVSKTVRAICKNQLEKAADELERKATSRKQAESPALRTEAEQAGFDAFLIRDALEKKEQGFDEYVKERRERAKREKAGAKRA